MTHVLLNFLTALNIFNYLLHHINKFLHFLSSYYTEHYSQQVVQVTSRHSLHHKRPPPKVSLANIVLAPPLSALGWFSRILRPCLYWLWSHSKYSSVILLKTNLFLLLKVIDFQIETGLTAPEWRRGSSPFQNTPWRYRAQPEILRIWNWSSFCDSLPRVLV